MPNTIRVYPDGDVWVVKRDGNARASAIRNTQREAYMAAREFALNQGLSITVHSPNGQIQKVVNPQDRASEDGCFITTACINSKGLPDDCYELQTLRKFRDNYVRSLPNGNSLISKYYLIAPEIVKAINDRNDRNDIYKSLFTKISLACSLLESGRKKKAFTLYRDTVKELSFRFGLTE